MPELRPSPAPAAVLLAQGGGEELQDLAGREPPAALPFAGRRLCDLPIACAQRAGIRRLVVVTDGHDRTLRRHIPERWGGAMEVAFAPTLPDGPLLLLSGRHALSLDLSSLLAAPCRGGAAVAVGADGAPAGAVAVLLEAGAAADPVSVWTRALAEGTACPVSGWSRRLDSLDAFRAAWLEAERGEVADLPPTDPLLLPPEDPLSLAFEAGGLHLSAPRFAAHRPERWTVIEDSVLMPGARVAPGARLSRAIIGPGAVVPAGLCLGHDPEEDARWFRVTPGGTTLVTAAMLARRAAARMPPHLSPHPMGSR